MRKGSRNGHTEVGASRVRTLLLVVVIAVGSAICFQMFGSEIKNMFVAIGDRIASA